MSRESDCIKTISQSDDFSGDRIIHLMLCDIAISLAQIADRLNGVILTNETSKLGWEELGGKGGEEE